MVVPSDVAQAAREGNFAVVHVRARRLISGRRHLRQGAGFGGPGAPRLRESPRDAPRRSALKEPKDNLALRSMRVFVARSDLC